MPKRINSNRLDKRKTVSTMRAKQEDINIKPGSRGKKTNDARMLFQANMRSNTIGGSERSVNGSAKAYMISFGCGIIESGDISKKEYSLLRDLCVDKEVIENENIFDSNAYSNLRNQGVEATDKFANTDDPFYQLDDSLSSVERQQITDIRNKSGARFVQFAIDLYKYNNSTKVTAADGSIITIDPKTKSTPVPTIQLSTGDHFAKTPREAGAQQRAKREAYEITFVGQEITYDAVASATGQRRLSEMVGVISQEQAVLGATTAQARRELSTLGTIASQELAAPGTGTAQRAQRQRTRTKKKYQY